MISEEVMEQLQLDLEEFASEYGRYMAPRAYDEFERILHKHICIPRGDCSCRDAHTFKSATDALLRKEES